MITSMEVNLPQFSSFVPNLIIPVVYPEPDALLYVKNITGLEPVNANIVTKGYGAQDGEYLVGRNIGKRNIVISLGLSTRHGGASVSEARAQLYGYMSPKALTKLIFHSDDYIDLAIEGYVESMTPNRFSQDPEIQVSIICPKPNFLSEELFTVTGNSGTDPADTEITYGGTVAVGILFELAIGASYSGAIFLESRLQGESVYRDLEMSTFATYPANSVFWMNSKKAEREVYYRLSGVKTNLLGKMVSSSQWPFLSSGVNEFRVRTEDSNTPRLWTLKYYEEFVGI